MCNCRLTRCSPFCPCPCHGREAAGRPALLLLAMANAEWKRAHPHGVVGGQVVTDSGEIEASPCR